MDEGCGVWRKWMSFSFKPRTNKLDKRHEQPRPTATALEAEEQVHG